MADKWIPNPTREMFPQRMRVAMCRKGVTINELSEMTNISPCTLYNYLKRRNLPSVERGMDIAQALEVSLSWLCGVVG